MSLDYPFYEELKRRSHPAAKWWRIGDILYYLGLLPAVLCIPAILVQTALAALGWSSWWWPLFTAAAFPIFVGVFILGGSLKHHSYRMAERDGITAKDVWEAAGRAGQGERRPGNQ